MVPRGCAHPLMVPELRINEQTLAALPVENYTHTPEKRQVMTQGLTPTAFGEMLPEDIAWMPFAAFPPTARLAVLVGDTTEPGPYVVRVKVQAGVKLMPHTHPEDRIYTVISGVFYIGLGKTFDAAKLKAYAPGSVIVLPGNTPHFHWARSGEYVTQVTGTGPLGIEYVDPNDDPRNQQGR